MEWQREREERERLYYSSNIREAVIQIAENLGEEPFWRGRAGELIEAAVKYNIGLRETNKEIGGFLNKMQGMFFDADRVLIEKIKNGTGPWIYKIYPKEKEEIPFL